ncbi:MAG: rRNA adenine N-6-methyltransferase family protein [Balneolaceae bacterium]|nr:rRNA adenine N-6-methyltransferase family protein [Balneolaceae bacterium]
MEHLIQFIKHFKKIGAIAPSSKFLAKDLAKQLQADVSGTHCPPLNILEIGPGTGSLTKEIVRYMRGEDHLDIVELHQHFYQHVKNEFSQPNIQVHHTDILQFESNRNYNYIFSSLPYENMPSRISRNIWQKKLELCSENAFICYFKYVNFRRFKSDFEEQIVRRYQRDKKIVLLNIPPAKLFTLEIDESWKKPFSAHGHVA